MTLSKQHQFSLLIYAILRTDSPEYERALGALTKERKGYGLLSSNRLPFGSKKAQTGGPIPETMMVNLLNYLFPDAEGDVEVYTLRLPIVVETAFNVFFIFQKIKTNKQTKMQQSQTHPYPEQFQTDCSASIDSTWKV